MRVPSDRRYGFDRPVQEVWSALVRVDRYPDWWGWLREFDGRTFAAGAEWRCVVKPWLPYTVAFTIRLTDVAECERATAELSGDIRGTAALTVTDRPEGCELRLVSDLESRHGAARVIGRVAPMLAARGHDWVLDTGIRQFRAVGFRP